MLAPFTLMVMMLLAPFDTDANTCDGVAPLEVACRIGPFILTPQTGLSAGGLFVGDFTLTLEQATGSATFPCRMLVVTLSCGEPEFQGHLAFGQATTATCRLEGIEPAPPEAALGWWHCSLGAA